MKAKDLDALPNLQARHYKQGDRAGVRKTGESKADDIAAELKECGKPSEVVALAVKTGFLRDAIVEKAKAAPNFGQFRMTIGNLMRGAVNRFERAKANGNAVSMEEACRNKKAGSTAKPRASKASKKKAAKKTAVPKKAAKKKAAKKAPAKKAAKKASKKKQPVPAPTE